MEKEVQQKGLEGLKNERGKQNSCEERLEAQRPVGTQSWPKEQGEGSRERRRGNIQSRVGETEQREGEHK